ncbi:HYC_CC_PP family protein [Oceanihabitans sediminis]|uniref:Secreted protein n=1 Tax=Oceanihabitans sediminis TaxID=1812012 RepID=A0A368P608_9FLAO|nr:hypothetical protein [Oceanihabitans sediminis]MDX1278364.1 hypothetical protein [Oceanihabitans sediminis]MDX1772592.1 hypothetical protein [Oceanihabitans sediminis]RBP34259.1 hypothetical protein DFR65_101143 [Oceanihabitans sediminis]RCU57948.1 hypothetical protein DU428_00725 [Oceanihabitans sediminis]
MIKKVLHTSFSIVLAFLVLFSTVSMTVEKHFCGDNLIDISLFSEAKSCGPEIEEVSAETSVEMMSCCKDEIEVIQGQDAVKTPSFDDIDIEEQVFLTTFAFSYMNLFEIDLEQIIPHKNYTPPNIVVDIQLVNDVFLI